MNSMTINISLPKPLVKRADKIAKNQFATRSDLIRNALFNYIEKRETWDKIFEWGKEAGEKMSIKSEADVNRIIEDYRNAKGKA